MSKAVCDRKQLNKTASRTDLHDLFLLALVTPELLKYKGGRDS